MADLRSYFQGFDLDTGAGTDLVLGLNLRLSASGGSIEALGQKSMASSIPVVLASDQTAVNVNVGAAVNPVTNYQTSAALAAGSTVALTTPEAASKRLKAVHVWSTVAFKATLHTVDNAVESAVKGIGGGPPFVPWGWPGAGGPSVEYVTLGATAGLDAFRVNVTNMDDANAADVHAVFYYQD